MEINEKYSPGLKLINSTPQITDVTLRKLLENCFSSLTGGPELHSINSLYSSKPDVIKEMHASLLYLIVELVRHNLTKQEVHDHLTNTLSFPAGKCTIFCDLFDKNHQNLEIHLQNMGKHPTHVVDVTWKTDYIVKTNSVDPNDGPLFRISLLGEEFDENTSKKVPKIINFSCNSEELQDLVLKLKDAARHCSKLPSFS